MKSAKGAFRILRSIIPTVWFNFRYLPFRQAVKLPILLYKPRFHSCKGKVSLGDGPVRPGMVRLGFLIETVYPNSGFLWDNRGGEVVFRGGCIIGNDSRIRVEEGGRLEFGDGVLCTASLKLVCHRSVTIGDKVLVGWENTIVDTDFHRIKDESGTFVGSAVAPVSIGHHSWLCSQVLTLKGTAVPPRCIVAARSVLNTGYQVPECSLLAGAPARLRKQGIWQDIDDPSTNELG